MRPISNAQKDGLANKLEQALTTDELAKLKQVGVIKLMEVTRQIYNELCRSCQIKVVHKPKMSLNEYCVVCRQKATNKMRALIDTLPEEGAP